MTSSVLKAKTAAWKVSFVICSAPEGKGFFYPKMEQPPPYPGPPGYGNKQPLPTNQQQPGYQAITTTVIQQPGPVFVGLRFLENPTAMICPFCQASIVTSTLYTPGTLTWIACGGVALMG